MKRAEQRQGCCQNRWKGLISSSPTWPGKLGKPLLRVSETLISTSTSPEKHHAQMKFCLFSFFFYFQSINQFGNKNEVKQLQMMMIVPAAVGKIKKWNSKKREEINQFQFIHSGKKNEGINWRRDA